MSKNVSRRKLFAGAGALAGGLAAGSAFQGSARAQQKSKGPAKLPDVWGEDFLYQWSPPANVTRDLTPGSSPIRLSHIGMTSAEGTDYGKLFQSMRDGGWTACEAPSAQWLSRKLKDSEIRDIKSQLKAHDINFYGIHCAGNIIAPDPEADQWQRHIIDAYHSAEEMGCELILTHTGSMYSNRNTPHPLNWSREGWNRSVNALKRIAKDTAGGKVKLAIEPVNSEAINNPWAQVRLREDVGDPRISSGLDITNFVYPGVAFRMSEFTNVVFDLLEDQIAYIHAKDFAWNGMMAGLNWAMNGTGNMDYEQFLVRISRVKHPVNMLVEFLSTEDEYQEAQRNIRAIAKKLGVRIEGQQKA
jgi:sugar phosphate isomerase/epimerase